MRFLLLLPILSAAYSTPVGPPLPEERPLIVQEKNIPNGLPLPFDVTKRVIDFLDPRSASRLSQASSIMYQQVPKKDIIKKDPVKYIQGLKSPNTPQEAKANVQLVLDALPDKILTVEVWKALRRNYNIPSNYWEDEVVSRVASRNIRLADEIVGSVLITAGGVGNLQVVKFLLHDTKVKNDDIGSALNLAAVSGHVNVVHELKNDPRVSDDSIVHALIAACFRHLDVVNELKNDPRVSNDSIGRAVTAAAFHGQLDIVKELKNDPRVGNYWIGKALESAAFHGHLNVVNELKNDPRVGNDRIGEALELAAQKGLLDVVQSLLSTGKVSRDDLRRARNAAVKGGYTTVSKILTNEQI